MQEEPKAINAEFVNLYQIFTQGREFVGLIPGVVMGAFVLLEDACMIRRYQIDKNHTRSEAFPLAKDKDYASGNALLSTAGAIIIELSPTGATYQLWKQAVSVITTLPEKKIVGMDGRPI